MKEGGGANFSRVGHRPCQSPKSTNEFNEFQFLGFHYNKFKITVEIFLRLLRVIQLQICKKDIIRRVRKITNLFLVLSSYRDLIVTADSISCTYGTSGVFMVSPEIGLSASNVSQHDLETWVTQKTMTNKIPIYAIT